MNPSFTPNENIEKLSNIPKTENDFESIRQLLHKAALEGDVQTIKYALSNGYCSVRNQNDHNIILDSSYKNDWKLVKLLIENGDDYKVVKYDNTNILHFFSQCENPEACQYLVNLIDPELETTYGSKAADLCHGNNEIIQILRSRNLEFGLRSFLGRQRFSLFQ